MKNTHSSMEPLFDNVLIKPLEAEQKTASGIILPDTAKEKPQAGEVIAIGKGAVNPEGKLLPMLVKVGDKVVYTKWASNEVKVDGQQLLLVAQKDILGILK